MKTGRLALTVASFALFVPAIFAQTTTAPATNPAVPQRKQNQQQRIGNGGENGSLTAGEAARIEKQESNLNKETRAMRQANGGKLTPQDRRIVNRQQNRLSREIYNQKHDAQVQPAAKSEVNARQKEQQERIGQGIKSGSLTPAEAANLEHKDARINREVNTMRNANGGTLTPGEKAAVNRQQDRVSRKIYNKKHNGRVQ